MTGKIPTVGTVPQLNALKREQSALARSRALLLARQYSGSEIQISTVRERDTSGVNYRRGRA